MRMNHRLDHSGKVLHDLLCRLPGQKGRKRRECRDGQHAQLDVEAAEARAAVAAESEKSRQQAISDAQDILAKAKSAGESELARMKAELRKEVTRLVVETSAKVTADVLTVDQKKRLVTLRGPEGNERTIRVGEEVRNLPQVKKGDQVVVSYYESAVFQLHKKGTATPGGAVVEGADRAKPGELPGAAGARSINVTATVVKVDKKAPSLTLKGPDGKTFTLPVKDASRLDAVKEKDLLEITYTEAMAVEVEKAPAPKK